MKIKVTSVYVDDQDKALRFYTEVLGFAKKADFSQGPFRWLTVASAEEPDGTELQLALNNNPAAKTYQQAIFQQSQPAAMFFTDDVQADYERMKARGAEFTMPPTDVTASKIAMLNDTCGNLIQVTQLRTLVGRIKEKKMTDCAAVHTGSRQRGAGTKGRREVDAHSGQRTSSPAGDGVAGADRPGAPARVGALRSRWEPGRVGAGEALDLGGTPTRRSRNHSDASRRSRGCSSTLGRQRSPVGTRSRSAAARA